MTATVDTDFDSELRRASNPSWQNDLRDGLRMAGPYAMHWRDLERAVRDYLDHHGDLAEYMRDVSDEDLDDHDPADAAREILHRHLLVITLLLERVDVHEWHRAERQYLETHPRLAAASS